MRSSLKRVAVFGAVLAATGLASGTAFGLGAETSRDHDVRLPSVDTEAIGSFDPIVEKAIAAAWDAADRALGLGGVRPGPVPAPTPGIRPEALVNAAIQTAAGAGEDVGRGLGGVVVPPIPSPTPSIQPDPENRITNTANRAIQTAGNTVQDASRGLGGVVVPPVPSPTPNVLPEPKLP